MRVYVLLGLLITTVYLGVPYLNKAGGLPPPPGLPYHLTYQSDDYVVYTTCKQQGWHLRGPLSDGYYKFYRGNKLIELSYANCWEM